jgi:hypothetical protein
MKEPLFLQDLLGIPEAQSGIDKIFELAALFE